MKSNWCPSSSSLKTLKSVSAHLLSLPVTLCHFQSLVITSAPTSGRCHKHVLCTPKPLEGIVILWCHEIKLVSFKFFIENTEKCWVLTCCPFLSLWYGRHVDTHWMTEGWPRIKGRAGGVPPRRSRLVLAWAGAGSRAEVRPGARWRRAEGYSQAGA